MENEIGIQKAGSAFCFRGKSFIQEGVTNIKSFIDRNVVYFIGIARVLVV